MTRVDADKPKSESNLAYANWLKSLDIIFLSWLGRTPDLSTISLDGSNHRFIYEYISLFFFSEA